MRLEKLVSPRRRGPIPKRALTKAAVPATCPPSCPPKPLGEGGKREPSFSLRTAQSLSNRIPWIKRIHSGCREVIHISRHDCHAMHKSRRRDQRITLRPRVGNMQARALQRDGGVDSKNAAFETSKDLI